MLIRDVPTTFAGHTPEHLQSTHIWMSQNFLLTFRLELIRLTKSI